MADDNKCLLPTLPTELLQHILTFVDNTDLTTLRLSSKGISKAVQYAFADKYLRHITCFAPNPARLARIKNICSQPYLACEVRQLVLTASVPFVGHPARFHVAAKQGQSHEGATLECGYRESIEQLELHGNRPPDFGGLLDVLRCLDPSKCRLLIDLRRILLPVDTTGYPRIAHELLKTISQAGFPIFKLYLSEHTAARLNYLYESDQLLQPMQGLREFHFHLCLDDEGAAETDQIGLTSSLHVMPRIIAAATHLETLRYEMESFIRQGPEELIMTNLASDMLLAVNSHCLSELKLTCVRLRGFQDLFEGLRRCFTSLRCIELEEFTIRSPYDRWVELFEYLRTLPKLKRLEMRLLGQVSQQGSFQIHVAVWERPLVTRLLSMNTEGSENIQVGLSDIIKRGIVYKEFDA